MSPRVIDRQEQRRLEAIEEDRRAGLRARLRWQYGPEEGERRFRGEGEGAADLEAWRKLTTPGPEGEE